MAENGCKNNHLGLIWRLSGGTCKDCSNAQRAPSPLRPAAQRARSSGRDPFLPAWRHHAAAEGASAPVHRTGESRWRSATQCVGGPAFSSQLSMCVCRTLSPCHASQCLARAAGLPPRRSSSVCATSSLSPRSLSPLCRWPTTPSPWSLPWTARGRPLGSCLWMTAAPLPSRWAHRLAAGAANGLHMWVGRALIGSGSAMHIARSKGRLADSNARAGCPAPGAARSVQPQPPRLHHCCHTLSPCSAARTPTAPSLSLPTAC